MSEQRTMQLPDDATSTAAAHAVIDLVKARPLSFPPDDLEVGWLAVGWMLRLCRTAEAALILQAARYQSEAAPLIRSCMQHAAALSWLSANKSTAYAVVTYKHRDYQRKLAADMEAAGWEVDISDEIRAVIAASEPEQPEGTGKFADFKQLCAAIDFPLLYVTYRLDSQLTHPSFLSAAAYWDTGEDGQDGAFVYAEPMEHVPSIWVAAVMLIGASAFDTLSPNQQFREGILEVDRSLGLGLLIERAEAGES